MTNDRNHEDGGLRIRTIGRVFPGPCDDAMVIVEHVYEPDGVDACDCGAPTHDPGVVGLLVGHGEDSAAVTLFAEEALELANRLTRAASLVLESQEDCADMEREAARLAAEKRAS